MSYIVYMHTSPSGKVYVGITQQTAQQRWRGGKGYKTNQAFYNAIQKYGWENIKHEIIVEDVSKEEATKLEQELIEKYHATDKRYGYNICFGGEDGWVGVHHTEEAKQKMSEAAKGRISSRKGFHLSEETKQKISDSHKGKYRGAPIESKVGKPYRRKRNGIWTISYPKEWFPDGKITRTEEHKKRISEAQKKRIRTAEVCENMSRAQTKTKKSVRCVDTGEVFESETAAMKRFNIDKTLIGRNCKGKQKTAKGLRFEYVNKGGN